MYTFLILINKLVLKTTPAYLIKKRKFRKIMAKISFLAAYKISVVRSTQLMKRIPLF